VGFTTSTANVKGFPMISASSASKAALRSMARCLASERLPHGIRVNAVSPGPVETPILGKIMPKDAADEFVAQLREAVAKALAFLAFEAPYTTGAELAVDGGS
jgi:NAD(P)-dependent dehydrogenase (short-subunit alcohol dehydrogenase family)